MESLNIGSPPDPKTDPVSYLRSLYAVRDKAKIIYEKAVGNQLRHFRVDWSKFDDVTAVVCSIIKRDFGDDLSKIPPHGRWQHIDAGDVPRTTQMMDLWSVRADGQPIVDDHEKCRRLIDLFLVSVLLDAGAGDTWSYCSVDDGAVYRRSEGIAVASFEMFREGAFSSDPTQPHQVDAAGLQKLTIEQMESGFQVTPSNRITGITGRLELLHDLGKALDQNASFFGAEHRPGYMMDYLLTHPHTKKTDGGPQILLPDLWTVLIEGFLDIWPVRHTLEGQKLGDCFPLATLGEGTQTFNPSNDHKPEDWPYLMPFHKLTQWLTYSLMPIMTRLLNAKFVGVELLTGLPEYRNGGLFVDHGLLILRSQDAQRGLRNFQANAGRDGGRDVEVVPLFEPDDEVIVEWRAVTLGLLDRLGEEVNSSLGLSGDKKLTLAQVLEAGSWKGGREIAQIARPVTKGPPIAILSDGTLF